MLRLTAVPYPYRLPPPLSYQLPSDSSTLWLLESVGLPRTVAKGQGAVEGGLAQIWLGTGLGVYLLLSNKALCV